MQPQNNNQDINAGSINPGQNFPNGVNSFGPAPVQQATAPQKDLKKSFQTSRNITIIIAAVCLVIRVLLSVFFEQIITFVFSGATNMLMFVWLSSFLPIILVVPTTVFVILTIVKYIRYKSTLPNNTRNYREAFFYRG